MTHSRHSRWHLLGHLIATILLVVVAAIAVWMVLGSDAPSGNTGWGVPALTSGRFF
ncbi:MAG: hypothetical protein JWR32_187 [Mycobacterium sp.]|jgi:hypothetical protein|nr:hypothetical protein [Mycobacterium sp.]